MTDHTFAELTTEVVAAYVAHNAVQPSDVPALIRSVHATLSGLGAPAAAQAAPSADPKPAVPIKRSVFEDYIVCLDDGRKLKGLKRHLGKLGMTPDEYRRKWSLDPDYPMVAPSYAKARSALAKEMGLGQRRRAA